MASRILLIDDDPKLTSLLERGLAYEGFDVRTAHDGESGLQLAESQAPHVVLLDISMPEPDGLEVCRQLRLRQDVPIIMVTARDDLIDKVNALNLGADDYVPKPFAFEELVARIRAVLRRHQASNEPIEYGDVSLNPVTREVRRNGEAIDLTPTEYELLLLFMRHPRQVLTRQQVLEQVWGYESPDMSVLDVHMAHLRQKLEAHGPRLLQTIRGIGFALRG